VALAALQDPSRVATLFPPRDAPLRPRFLLVLRFLPVALPAHVEHRGGRSTTSQAGFLQAVLSRDFHAHVIPVVGVLAVVSSSRDPFHHAGVFPHLRVPVLDLRRDDRRPFATGVELPDYAAWVQLGVPRWGAFAAFFHRGV